MAFSTTQNILTYLRDACIVPTSLALQIAEDQDFHARFETCPPLIETYVAKRIKSGPVIYSWPQWLLDTTYCPVSIQAQQLLKQISVDHPEAFLWCMENPDLQYAIIETINRVTPALLTPQRGAVTEIFAVHQCWSEALGNMFWVINTPQQVHGKTTKGSWFSGTVMQKQMWVEEPGVRWLEKHPLDFALCVGSGGVVLRNVFYAVSETPQFESNTLLLQVRALGEGE